MGQALSLLGHRLKAANISVPVIYMTGNDNPATREAAHQSGCLAYLTKPFSAKSLMEPLHRAAIGLASFEQAKRAYDKVERTFGGGRLLPRWRWNWASSPPPAPEILTMRCLILLQCKS